MVNDDVYDHVDWIGKWLLGRYKHKHICDIIHIYIEFDPTWLKEAGQHHIWSAFTSGPLWKTAGEPKTVHSSIVTAFQTRPMQNSK